MIPKYDSNFFLISSLQTLVKLRNTQFLAFTSMLLQKSYLSTSVLTMLLTLLVLDFGSENGPWRNLQFLPNWHLPSRNQFLHFSGGYDSLDLERYVKKKNYRLLSIDTYILVTFLYWLCISDLQTRKSARKERSLWFTPMCNSHL